MVITEQTVSAVKNGLEQMIKTFEPNDFYDNMTAEIYDSLDSFGRFFFHMYINSRAAYHQLECKRLGIQPNESLSVAWVLGELEYEDVVILFNETEKIGFSSFYEASQFLECTPQKISSTIRFGKELSGYKIKRERMKCNDFWEIEHWRVSRKIK